MLVRNFFMSPVLKSLFKVGILDDDDDIVDKDVVEDMEEKKKKDYCY